jgi:hypothetical protein
MKDESLVFQGFQGPGSGPVIDSQQQGTKLSSFLIPNS